MYMFPWKISAVWHPATFSSAHVMDRTVNQDLRRLCACLKSEDTDTHLFAKFFEMGEMKTSKC